MPLKFTYAVSEVLTLERMPVPGAVISGFNRLLPSINDHELSLLAIDSVIEHPRRNLVRRAARASRPTLAGGTEGADRR